MRRVCFIGNSHIGAIKRAVTTYDDIECLSNVELSLFGTPGGTLQSVRLRDGVLRSDNPKVQQNFLWTSGVALEIDVSGFDEIFMVAGQSYLSIFPFIAGKDVPHITRGMFEEIWDLMVNGWAINTCRKIAESNPEVFNYLLGHRRRGRKKWLTNMRH
ncbi:MAG: hypothetical protein AAFY25_02005, partial [Pseudomonadota bacterium]